MTITLPGEIESQLNDALDEVRSLAVAGGRDGAFASRLRYVEESVRDALTWQSRALAEHALRVTQALRVELEGPTLVAAPDGGPA